MLGDATVADWWEGRRGLDGGAKRTGQPPLLSVARDQDYSHGEIFPIKRGWKPGHNVNETKGRKKNDLASFNDGSVLAAATAENPKLMSFGAQAGPRLRQVGALHMDFKEQGAHNQQTKWRVGDEEAFTIDGSAVRATFFFRRRDARLLQSLPLCAQR